MKDVVGVWGACLFLWASCLGGVALMDRADQPSEETDTVVAFSAPACYPDMVEEEL